MLLILQRVIRSREPSGSLDSLLSLMSKHLSVDDTRPVDEDVPAAIQRVDEAEALLIIVELHLAPRAHSPRSPTSPLPRREGAQCLSQRLNIIQSPVLHFGGRRC